jgi:hypothetical protein
MDHFNALKQQLPVLNGLSGRPREVGYFAQEALRFCSIAGTLKESDLLKNASADERHLSHILGRSLLEGFFWLIYIFDDPTHRSARFDEKLQAFKRDYGKFWNERLVPGKSQMQQPDASWAALPKPKDVCSMLSQVKNDHGDRLSYLYFVYRVASFDTHGNSMDSLFQAVFGTSCSFSVLNLDRVFDLIANEYLAILQELNRPQNV